MPRREIVGVNWRTMRCDINTMSLAKNPRDYFDPEKWTQLREQIKAAGRVYKPVTCLAKPDNSGLLIYDGQRRYLVTKELLAEGYEILEELPFELVIGNSMDAILRAATCEGEPLDDVSKIRQIQMALDAGATQAVIAERLGYTPSWVSQMAALVTLSEPAKLALREGLITQGKARQLAKLAEDEQNVKLESIRQAKANGNKSAGRVAPKRPVLKQLRLMAERFESAAGASQGEINAFQTGVSYAMGELTAEQVAEQYKLEVE